MGGSLVKQHTHHTTKYVSVIRDPVATVASARRMEQLMLGPILTPTLEDYLQQGHLIAEGGWLDNVLRWWSVRDRPNVLILEYEEMVSRPREAVEHLAGYIGVALSEGEAERVVEKMSLKWSLENSTTFKCRRPSARRTASSPRARAFT